MFNILVAWRDRWSALRELNTIQRAEREIARAKFDAIIEEANGLFSQGNVRGARERLQRIRASAGTDYATPGLLRLLLDLGDLDHAELLMQRGHREKPRALFFLEGLALVAQQRNDFEVAADRWARFRKRFPAWPAGYSQGGVCLAKLGRLLEADRLLEKAIRSFPNDVICHSEYAKVADIRGDLDEALRRWQLLQGVQGGGVITLAYQLGTIGLAQALRKLRRFDEAERHLKEMRAAHPLNILPAIELAGIAQDRGDVEESVRRWQTVKSRFPLAPTGYSNLAALLKQHDRLAEAEEVLGDAVGRFEGDFTIAFEYADIADRRQDWESAAQRWRDVRGRFPNHGDAYRRAADALRKLGRTSEAEEVLEERRRISTQVTTG